MDKKIIDVSHLSKAYRLYDKKSDRLREAISWSGKKYHKTFYALDDISFCVERGETLGIVGTNGSGKSTLLKILSGVVAPTSGEVRVNGKISALLELGAGFNPEYSGLENIALNGTMMGYTAAEMNVKREEIIRFADIGEYINQPVKTYSSGMFARLAFATAINVEPDILIVDETLSVGDIRFQIKCMDRMKTMMENGTTILFVSHDISAVRRFCTKCIWIHRGILRAWGETNEVADRYTDFLRCGDEISFRENSGRVQANSVDEEEPNLTPFLDSTDKSVIASIVHVSVKNGKGQEKAIFGYDEVVFAISAKIHTFNRPEYYEIFSAVQQLPIISTQYEQMEHEKRCVEERLREVCIQRDACREHLQQKDVYIDELKLCIQQSEERYNDLQQHIEQLKKYNESLQERYQSISTSYSWRVTKPIRVVLDAIKKTRLGGLLYKSLRSFLHFGLRATLKKIKMHCFCKKVVTKIECVAPKTLADMATRVIAMGGQVYNREQLLNSKNIVKKKMLLVSHELNLTGAPVALGYFAKAVHDKNYLPVIVSPYDGTLCGQLCEDQIPIFIYEDLFNTDFISQCAEIFDMVVVCTNVGAPLVDQLNGKNIPVLWWIHEARASYHPHALEKMPDTLAGNVHVYCVGMYAERILKEYRPGYQSKQLLYYVPDYALSLPSELTFHLRYADGKMVFAIVGSQEERKGQDVLVEAIRMLKPEVLRQCLFVFVGKKYYKPIEKAISSICEDYPRNVQYIEELEREALTSLYVQMNCLICASTDDPMPIVVTEAMLMSKPIICSENTGSADILEQMHAGIIYRNNDAVELTQCIEFVYTHREAELMPMCRQARQAYESFFSKDAFDRSIEEVIADISTVGSAMSPFKGTVSVVIPTYNAGESIDTLIESLQKQEKIGGVEIVIVDSESKDQTAERAERLGAKVIRIRQAEFSHSYARNLGAENATGEYLLFMTQDAMPNGSEWICGLMQPVLHSNAVAVSCQETPKPDCDLLGRIAIWYHSEYMGILEKDRLMRLPTKQDYDSLRRNGQLNDVTCLVQRELFLQFKYRGNFAEDLDLGIRLIQAGHTLALMSKVQVIHSHTRPPLYHLKRSLVDLKILHTILPDMPTEMIDAQTVANRAVTAYCAMVLYVKMVLATYFAEDGSWKFFCRWSQKSFLQIKRELAHTKTGELLNIIQTDTKLLDEDIQSFVETIFCVYKDGFVLDMSLAEAWFYFLTHIVSRYFSTYEMRFDERLRQEVVIALPKYMAQLFGNLLASYAIAYPKKDGILSEMIIKYSAGV